MKKTRLELRLKDKILSVNRENISLDDSLFDADSFNKEGTDYLELKYNSQESDLAEKEAERIYHFLEKQKLPKLIAVSESPEDANLDYPIVTLFGEFDARVYD